MTFSYTLELDTTWAFRLAGVAARLHPIIGVDRAFRLAMWLAYRLARWRIAGGPWRRGIDRSTGQPRSAP